MLVFDRLGLSLYSSFSAVQSTNTAPSFDTDAYLAKIWCKSCEYFGWVLTVALLPLFLHTRLLRSDGGAPEPADPVDDYYYPDGAYYYVEADDQE